MHLPLFEAAVAADLAVCLRRGGVSGDPPTSVGWPSYFVEEQVAMATAYQAQLLSMVCEGLLARFPSLRIGLMESGWSWLPALAWRLDKDWKGLRREVPWVAKPPLESLAGQVWATLHPSDGPPSEELLATLATDFPLQEVLMFSTGFPHWHVDAADELLALPDCLSGDEASERLLRGNAEALYGFPEGR
jgi:predicted TIM-barrel fold metal-dependent hydrolase